MSSDPPRILHATVVRRSDPTSVALHLASVLVRDPGRRVGAAVRAVAAKPHVVVLDARDIWTEVDFVDDTYGTTILYVR
jgi:hypothetical protein